MTSEERHEARYQRRVKRRQERRLELSRSCGDFEDVFSFDNLYRSGHICCRGVAWKSSTQMYRFNLVTNTAATRRALLDGTYKSRGFKFLQVRFKLTETGKVLRKMSYESIKKMRRKLAKFKRWNEEGREVVIGGKRIRKIFSLSDICKAFGSWLGHMKRGKNFHAIQRMKSYFKTLFGFHPDNKVKWRAAICT